MLLKYMVTETMDLFVYNCILRRINAKYAFLIPGKHVFFALDYYSKYKH